MTTLGLSGPMPDTTLHKEVADALARNTQRAGRARFLPPGNRDLARCRLRANTDPYADYGAAYTYEGPCSPNRNAGSSHTCATDGDTCSPYARATNANGGARQAQPGRLGRACRHGPL